MDVNKPATPAWHDLRMSSSPRLMSLKLATIII